MTTNKKYLIPLSLIFSLWLYMAPGYASVDGQLNAQNDLHATTILRLWASIGPSVYLNGAKIIVKNNEGKIIGKGLTNERGTAMLTLPEEEARVTPLHIRTSGGREKGVLFRGHLEAQASKVGLDAPIVFIDILSTVGTRLAKWKDTYPEALTAIRAKLGISPYAPVDVLRVRNNYVDYAKLQAFVVQQGGFDKLIDKMVQAVESGTKITWPDVKTSVPSVPKATLTVANSTSMLVSAAPTTTSVMASTATTSTTATGTTSPTCTTAVGTNTTSSNASTQVIEDFGVIAGASLLKMAGMPSVAITASTDLVGMLFGASPAVSADTQALANIQTELDCISQQINYLTVQINVLTLNDAMQNAGICASTIKDEWQNYNWIVSSVDGTAANAIGPQNTTTNQYVANWMNLKNCSGIINDVLFPTAGSGLISGWQQMNTNTQFEMSWYTSAQVQQLQSFLSYWGTLSYQAFTLNNEYFNYQSSYLNQNETSNIKLLTGMAYDSSNNAIFNENGVPVCSAGTTSNSRSFCAYQSNIANAFPGDLYSDEIGLYTTGMAVSAYPGGLAITNYSNHGQTVSQPSQMGLNDEQIAQQYQHVFNWTLDETITKYADHGVWNNWYWGVSNASYPSLDQFNAQGINPGNTDGAIETFTNPKAKRTQTPKSTDAAMSPLTLTQTSGGATASSFFGLPT